VVVAGAAGLLVVLGGGALLLVSQGGKKPAAASPAPTAEPAPTTLAPAPTPVPKGPTGTLVIDALPWGEVAAVVDTKGVRHPAASRYTPLAMVLPAGEYTIEVRNPSFPHPVSLKASVRAAATETRVAEFRRVDAAAYFRKAGLTP
jgi:hypothetical protein